MNKHVAIITAVCMSGLSLMAGNKDRSGEAGAYELLINGWGRSSGVFSLNSATISGVESERVNPAGMAFIKSTEANLSYTSWLSGSGIGIAKAAVGQKFGGANVIGLSVESVNLGSITRTTTSLPEGGIGSFKPNFLNIGISYARVFSNSIYGGMTLRFVNERIEDVNASGFALDAGIQYVSGKRDNIHFGVAIRNMGTPMRYTGDGLSITGVSSTGYAITQQQRADKFPLPSLLHIGGAYDFYIGPEPSTNCNPINRLTLMGQFTSNSIGKDHFGLGLEYAFREMFMIRAGYRYESAINSVEDNTSAYKGLAAGATVGLPVGKNGTALALDYSYRLTRSFNGTHSMGLRVNIGGGPDDCRKTKKQKAEETPAAL